MKIIRNTQRRRWPHIDGWLPVMMLIGGLLSCCNNDGIESITSLPDGKYPLQLTTEVAQPQTRAGGKDTWTGGEEIRVAMEGVFGNKTYVMDASGNASPKDADNAFYWKNTDEARISAWTLNLEMGESETDISDQSGGYAAFDVLYATAIGRYDQAVNLRFQHRMAKIEVNLKAGEGITEEELEGATVTIFGDPVTHSTCGMVSPGNQSDGEINPYRDAATKKYEALVPPQNMTGKPLVRISIGSNAFTYTPATEAAGNFWMFGGKRYAYTITVKANGIDVQTVTGATWSDGGEESITSSKVINYTADEVKAGDYIYSDGTTSDGGLRKRYSDGKQPVVANPKPQPLADKTVVGIVFWVPKDTDPSGRVTPASLSYDKIMAKDFPNCTHGLAVSLKDFSRNAIWQMRAYITSVADFQSSEKFTLSDKHLYQSIALATGYSDNINRILGYQNTKVMQEFNDYHLKRALIHPVVRLLYPYVPSSEHQAPAGSTGWYIPSAKELYIARHKDIDGICNRPYGSNSETIYIVNASLSAAGGDALYGAYWSSMEYTHNKDMVYVCDFNTQQDPVYTCLKYYRSTIGVRGVCAF